MMSGCYLPKKEHLPAVRHINNNDSISHSHISRNRTAQNKPGPPLDHNNTRFPPLVPGPLSVRSLAFFPSFFLLFLPLLRSLPARPKGRCCAGCTCRRLSTRAIAPRWIPRGQASNAGRQTQKSKPRCIPRFPWEDLQVLPCRSPTCRPVWLLL
jgi:hypothetical protein